MDKLDLQHFYTISGLPISYSSFTNENDIEIIIENLTYATESKRLSRHVFIILSGCILLNFIIPQYVIPLNIIFLITIATKFYALINLVQYGKQKSLFYFQKCS